MPPLVRIMAFKRPTKPSQAVQKWLCGILTNSRRSAVLRQSTLWYFLVRTLLPKMLQAQKSNGLRSRDFGGHCAVEMKRGTSFLSPSWLTRAECGAAEFSWNGYGLRPKCLSAQGFHTVLKAFFRLYLAFITTWRSMKMSGGQPSAVTATHIITIGSAWVLLTNRRCKFSADLWPLSCKRSNSLFSV